MWYIINTVMDTFAPPGAFGGKADKGMDFYQ